MILLSAKVGFPQALLLDNGYLTDLRMRRARRLVECGDLSAAEIAERVGYASGAAFGRAFKQHFGASPRALRRCPPRTPAPGQAQPGRP